VIEEEQGYLVVAVNRDNVDYVAMAIQLAESLRAHDSQVKICLLTDHPVATFQFDFVKTLPFGDQGGYCNDWQAWSASPFRETIKLEADMLVTSPIDHWWTMLRNRDVVISTGARDYYDRDITTRFYRKIFDDNHLPDVYNAITYWRVSQTAQEFWKLIRSIFTSWTVYKNLLKFPPQEPDTDLVYAMAAVIMGPEKITLPFASYPKIVHMKQHAIKTKNLDWTHDLIWEYVDRNLRINTVSQWGCVHYNKKNWNINAQQQ
jgi:hypothetical protein